MMMSLSAERFILFRFHPARQLTTFPTSVLHRNGKGLHKFPPNHWKLREVCSGKRRGCFFRDGLNVNKLLKWMHGCRWFALHRERDHLAIVKRRNRSLVSCEGRIYQDSAKRSLDNASKIEYCC